MKKVRKVYAVKHKDEIIRAASRSGGTFTAISDIILENSGVVYGCALNDEFLAEHRRATTKEERDAFRGSKYIQSNIGDTYKQVREDLKNGLTVLYSGTPCQIEALNDYMLATNVNTDNLYTMDILCHGVPSARVWSDYLVAQSKGNKVISVDFRNKADYGWHSHVERITTDKETIDSSDYKNLFMKHIIMRDSCFKCDFRSFNRISDITIGDCWRIENVEKEFDDNKGISLVILNSEKAQNIFSQCSDNLIIKEYPLILFNQPGLNSVHTVPSQKKAFWNEYDKEDLHTLIEKYLKEKITIKQRIKLIIKKIIRIAV